ncbi:MAG: SAM-dependent methyltransferase, partial [Planctomycetaceae bacterium]|nr:SAM-dependent methyltransferase [Planctomycetaceae bacterium]
MEEGPAAPDSALRFEAVAAGYARHRPGYPRPFLGSLLSLAGIEPGSGAEVV